MGWWTKDKTDYNNEGQKDASEGKDRSTPHANPVDFIVGSLFSDIGREMRDEDRAYNAGYDNAQKK